MKTGLWLSSLIAKALYVAVWCLHYGMKLTVKDWIMVWHFYHLVLFVVYLVVIMPAMFVCTRHLMSKRSTLAGILLSAVSFVVVVRYPIGGAVWMVIEGLTLGEQTQYSLLNGFSFVPLMALCGAISGAVILRFIFREHLGKKGFVALYLGNLVAITSATAAVLIWASIYPWQAIA